MSRSERKFRVRRSIAAAAAGYCAALIVTLPMVLLRLFANRDGGLRPLDVSLSASALIWLLWTLPMVMAEWFFGLLPVVLLVREDWLLRHRKQVLWASAMLGWLPALVKFKVWSLVLPDRSLSGWLFSLYSLLQVIAPLAATFLYLRWTAATPREVSESKSAPSVRA